FADAMQRNGNNLDTTINNWAGEVAKTKSTVDATQKPVQ
ncbi:toluene tolerance, partial [Pseudomonas syringae pv. pisi str. 1704B]